MKITSVLNFKVVGYLILAYAGISYLMANTGAIQGVGAPWYNQLILTILAGISSIFLDGQKVTFKNVFNWILTKLKVLKPSEDNVIDNDILDDISEIAEKLNKIGDAEGVALCKQLNSHVFDAIFNAKPVVKVEDTPNASK